MSSCYPSLYTLRSLIGTLLAVPVAVTSRCVPVCQRIAQQDKFSTTVTAARCVRPGKTKRVAAMANSATRCAERAWNARCPVVWHIQPRSGGEARVAFVSAKVPIQFAAATGCPTVTSESSNGSASGRKNSSSHLFCLFSGEHAEKVTCLVLSYRHPLWSR